MQHDRKLEAFTFRGPFFIHKSSSREQILQNNHKHGSRPKYFNKNVYTSRSDPPKATCVRHKPKVKSFHFFDHITTSILWEIIMNPLSLSIHMNNTSEKKMNNNTHFIMRLRIKFLNNYYNKFNKMSIITSHHLQ